MKFSASERRKWTGIQIAPPEWDRSTGEDLFNAMTTEEQDAQFGTETAQKLRDGDITLADLVRRTSPGDTPGFIVAKPAKEVKKYDPHQLRDPHTGEWIDEPGGFSGVSEFAASVKKGQRVEGSEGRELRDGKWVPVEGPLRGAVVRADNNRVMINAGTRKKPRWVEINRANVSEIVRAKPRSTALRDDLGQSEDQFPADEREVLNKYTGGNKGEFGPKGLADSMNNSLRRGTPSRWRDFIDRLDSAFDRIEGLPEEGIVFRGTKVKGARSLEVGSVIEDPGYMSTSAVRPQAESFVAWSHGDFFEITLPSGTKALDLNRVSGSSYGNEREILLGRGTKMVVESIEPHPTRRLTKVFHVRVLPND